MIPEALDLFPGGVNSPIRSYRAVGGDPPTLVRGQGGHAAASGLSLHVGVVEGRHAAGLGRPVEHPDGRGREGPLEGGQQLGRRRRRARVGFDERRQVVTGAAVLEDP